MIARIDGVEPARGVHLQDDELGVLLRRPLQRAGDVLRRRRTDGAVDAQHDHRRRGRSVGITHPGQRRKQRERASEPDTGFHSGLRRVRRAGKAYTRTTGRVARRVCADGSLSPRAAAAS